MNRERREKIRQQIADYQFEVFKSTDIQLSNRFKELENQKLAGMSTAILGVSTLSSMITTQHFVEGDITKSVISLPIFAGALVGSAGFLTLLDARLKAQEILYEAKQRGLKILPGLHRSIEPDMPDNQ